MVSRQQQKLSLFYKENQPTLHIESTLRSGNTVLSALKRCLSLPISDVPPTPTLSISGSSSEEEDEEEYLLNQNQSIYMLQDEEKSTKGKRRCSDETIMISKRQKFVLDTTITKGANNNLEEYEDMVLPKRIDFVLQPEKLIFGLISNPYLSGLTAHFSYWTHQDLMWHIVRRLENK